MIIAIATTGQLGPQLQQLRKQQGLSQAALGRRIGLSQERISRIERMPEKVTFDQILTVLMALDAELQLVARTATDKRAAASAKGNESW